MEEEQMRGILVAIGATIAGAICAVLLFAAVFDKIVYQSTIKPIVDTVNTIIRSLSLGTISLNVPESITQDVWDKMKGALQWAVNLINSWIDSVAKKVADFFRGLNISISRSAARGIAYIILIGFFALLVKFVYSLRG
ncbi:MAG: hypothetical protein ACTSXX_06130 [Candidatus Baldrarchaeia archaeon]